MKMGVVNHEVRDDDDSVSYFFANETVAQPVIGCNKAEQARHYWHDFFFARRDGRIKRDITRESACFGQKSRFRFSLD